MLENHFNFEESNSMLVTNQMESRYLRAKKQDCKNNGSFSLFRGKTHPRRGILFVGRKQIALGGVIYGCDAETTRWGAL